MHHVWGRTILTILIIMTFFMPISALENNSDLTTRIVPHDNTLFVTENGTTWYVDDDATPPFLGTLEQPFKKIQDGIDNANDGDTVYVYNGIYYEHILIYKAINLIGEYNNRPTIDGGDETIDIINILSDLVNISGFKLSGKSTEQDFAILNIDNHCNITISDCNFSATNFSIESLKSPDGLYARESKYISIINCDFHYCDRPISTDLIFHMEITNCIFYLNRVAISLRGANHVNINNCTMQSNGFLPDTWFWQDFGSVIYIYEGQHIMIDNNTIKDNLVEAIALSGFDLNDNLDIFISDNIIKNNFFDGIIGQNCTNVTVIDNIIDGNKYDGIEFNYCSNVSCIKNIVKNNGFDGICLDYYCYDNRIINNTISYNKEGGIEVVFYSSRNDIWGNIIQNNRWDGIYIGLSSEDNFIIGNNIKSNFNGIALRGNANNNYVWWNKVQRNKVGINLIWGDNFYNDFYNNNLIMNLLQAVDMSTLNLNEWNRNYWSNYRGLDLNKDDYGDRPKLIFPFLNGNMDLLPSKNPISFPFPWW